MKKHSNAQQTYGRKGGKAHKTITKCISNARALVLSMVYTVDEACSILQVKDKRTLNKAIKRGQLRASHLPCGIRIKGSDLDEYLNKMLISSE
jgi:excisionase family DNA binding protein